MNLTDVSKLPSSLTATNAAARGPSQVEEWANNLNAVCEENSQLVREIEARLGAVIRGAENAPQPTLVPLADHLRNKVIQIDRTNNLLRDILRRTEV